MRPSRVIRIGTRDSALARYQALEVQKMLSSLGADTEIVDITSDGDIDLETPLYEMGIQGIFTKALDSALIHNKIDIAVHSCKDVPTRLANGLALSALLERGTPLDCIVLQKGQSALDFDQPGTVATSSLRRKLQWLNRYPHWTVENLRGNVQTRLKKVDESSWKGAIFARVALERLFVDSHHWITLDWMLPSPAQGAMAVVCRQDDSEILELCKSIDHAHTRLCITAERDFLAELHGGCAVPIAAYAAVVGDQLVFKGNVMSLDARQKCEVELSITLDEASKAGKLAAREIRQRGAEEIIRTFRKISE